MKINTVLFIWCFSIFISYSQSDTVLLMHPTVHTGTGKVIENAIVAISAGKIISIQAAHLSTINILGKKAYSLKNKHLYPAFIALNSSIGLYEIEAVRASRDYAETGDYNPNVRALVAYNTDNDIIATTRSNGILLAQIFPRGGILQGTSSVMKLYGEHWEDAVYKADEGIVLAWPSYYNYGEPDDKSREEFAKNRKKNMADIEKLFADAKIYAYNTTITQANLKLSALKGLYDGTKTLYIQAEFSKEIVEVINFCEKHGIKNKVIVGASKCDEAIDILKQYKIPVILNRIHGLPMRTDDDLAYYYSLPKKLMESGILVALSYYGDMEAMGTRNLPYLAGTAACYGMNREDALKLITYNAAKILNIDAVTGTIEAGKEANMVVSDGDVLDMRTSNIIMAMLQGIEIPLDNKHKTIYQKYTQKYKLKP
ncbi:MAG: amidohydrolase family protein [Cytophagales bacterium]|nr:amidohydrolase family protein [Cytophagales bacterium]